MGQETMAQCSQCKAAASSTDENGSYLFGQDINTGVLYLLALPVVLPFVVGGLWYYRVRTQRQRQALEQDLSRRSLNSYLPETEG